MPTGKRAEGQKLIPVPMSRKFVAEIDRAYRAEGFDDRSKFIRTAVREKLQAMGYPVAVEETLAPDRVKMKNPPHRSEGAELNDKPRKPKK